MIKYYILYDGREIEVDIVTIEYFSPILIECTSFNEYLHGKKVYVQGLIDEFDIKLVQEFEEKMKGELL